MVRESIPKEGENIKIQSYKHDGKIHRVWSETTILKGTDHVVIGGNDHTLVTESDGRTWITREPAIVYFHSEYWFNVICMFREDGIYYYCNLSSPFVCDEEALKYIDYDLDIKVYPNGKYHLLDEDEYEATYESNELSAWYWYYFKTQRGHSSTMDRTEEGPIRARFYQSLERTLQKN